MAVIVDITPWNQTLELLDLPTGVLNNEKLLVMTRGGIREGQVLDELIPKGHWPQPIALGQASWGKPWHNAKRSTPGALGKANALVAR